MINYRFRIENKLGKGRSTVYLCEDLDFPKNVIALKVLPLDAQPEEIKSFKNEFFTLRKFSHPNIIKAIDLGTIVKINSSFKELKQGQKFITLEYFAGSSLSGFNLKNNQKHLIDILVQICSVLQYLHQSNYIYYDLKPENILVSEINGRPFIKIIDMGFAGFSIDNNNESIKGTAEYIAPELLRSEPHDHRVDFYSLGMTLYKLIYGKYPFDNTDELNIYKAHLESEFEFPGCAYSDEVISIVKKLLSKNPDERFSNAFEIITSLEIPLEEEIIKTWQPAEVFAGRNDIVNMLRNYFVDEKNNNAISIQGGEGAGKTSVLMKIYSNLDSVVFLDSNVLKSGVDFIKYILKKIISSEHVYSSLKEESKEKIESVLFSDNKEIKNELKSAFSLVSENNPFILLLDDFNKFDEFTIELLKDIIPILQSHNVKIILTENTNFNVYSSFIYNLTEINLTPFTELQVKELLQKSFYKNYPLNDLEKLIILCADLMPGNIVKFIGDLIILNIIKYSNDGKITIEASNENLQLLKSSYEKIYDVRLSKLNNIEKRLVEFISSFKQNINEEILSKLCGLSSHEVNDHLNSIREKDILLNKNLSAVPKFISDGLAEYIYENIKNKKEHHKYIAETISNNFKNFNKNELARQFELAENYEKSFDILFSLQQEAKNAGVFSYRRKILERLLSYALDQQTQIELKTELAFTNYKTGDFNSAKTVLDELLNLNPDKKLFNDLELLNGSVLIGLGNVEEGKNKLSNLINEITDENRKRKILVEIADAELELSNFSTASKICNEVINNTSSGIEEKAKSFNLLGIIEIHEKNDFDSAIEKFNRALSLYEQIKLFDKVAAIKMNIGVIYNILGNYEKAEKLWKEVLNIIIQTGNIILESQLFLNFGVKESDNLKYDLALINYNKSIKIFSTIGNKTDEGKAYINLSEVTQAICEYEDTYYQLNKAINIFSSLGNKEEEAIALFMLAKLFYQLNDKINLNTATENLKTLIQTNNLTEKHKINYTYLEILNSDNRYLEKLKTIIDFYLLNQENKQYFAAKSALISKLIESGDFKSALVELENDQYINMCKGRFLYEAERLYFLGKIAESFKTDKLRSPLEYFEQAYDLMEDNEITELTWKILFALTEFYFKRGNIVKAKQYHFYAKELIFMISSKIKNKQLRTLYLSEPERKAVLEKFETDRVR